jgi:hypothetical protein
MINLTYGQVRERSADCRAGERTNTQRQPGVPSVQIVRSLYEGVIESDPQRAVFFRGFLTSF